MSKRLGSRRLAQLAEHASEGCAIPPENIVSMVDEILAIRGPQSNSLKSFAQDLLNSYRRLASNVAGDNEELLRRAQSLDLDIFSPVED